MQEYGTAWLALLGWLADRAPPLVAGFIGGVIGSIATKRWRKRHDRSPRRGDDNPPPDS